MSMSANYTSEQKLITCILPKGIAGALVSSLRINKGIITSNIDNARGAGHLTPLAYRGVGVETEKEILSVIVDPEQAESLFDWLYAEARINRPHGGIMYMTRLQNCTPYSLPEMDWEL